MIAQRIYFVFVLMLFLLSWKVNQTATNAVQQAQAKQAAKIASYLSANE